MANLRSKSIQGYVTDSAGNILRNSQIVIKTANPLGFITVDTTNTDGDGYFVSSPLPDGTYDIYESGLRVSRVYHSADKSKIQCYKPHSDNYPSNIPSFSTLVSGAKLNNFKWFLQIEPDFIDTFQLGSTYPIYNVDLNSIVDDSDDMYSLGKFFGLGSASRITTTRFDIEYYSPLTSISSQYKRIRWAGVPGIKFFEDSKIVVPIDYYSMVPSLPKVSIASSQASGITFDSGFDGDPYAILTDGGSNDVFQAMLPKVSNGDIVEVVFSDMTKWYGIVYSSGLEILLDKWLSSVYTSTPNINKVISKVRLYDGMFQNIFDINDTCNERFSVSENQYAQNVASDIYNYSNHYQS